MSPTAATDHSADDWAYRPGDVLADRFEIVESIARGAFGEVHAARDRSAGRRVALKILRTGSERRDPKAVARMRQEAEILRALDHPNLVRVHELDRIDRRECLVMELLDGRSLRDLIDAGELADADLARPVVRQILEALEAMHRRGVQHRDLKPENIVLLNDSTPAESGDDLSDATLKLVDFGIAKARNFLDPDHEQTLVETKDGRFVGTPEYSSPEQAVGDPVDDRSDLFAVGLVLAEWFTGAPRIEASTPREVASLLIRPDPLDVSDCPEVWRPWLSNILAKAPDERFPSARAALDEMPAGDRVSPRDRRPATRRSDGGAAPPDGSDRPRKEPSSEEETVVLEDSDTTDSVADPEVVPSDRRSPSPEATGREGAGSPDDSEHGVSPNGADPAREPTDASDAPQSTWFTAATVLLFVASLGIFVYTLIEVFA